MNILKLKKEILQTTGEIFEKENANIIYIDFLEEGNFLKVIICFKRNNKKYGISYMFSLIDLNYQMEEFNYRIEQEFKKLDRN